MERASKVTDCIERGGVQSGMGSGLEESYVSSTKVENLVPFFYNARGILPYPFKFLSLFSNVLVTDA
jgi:hypothetical protein